MQATSTLIAAIGRNGHPPTQQMAEPVTSSFTSGASSYTCLNYTRLTPLFRATVDGNIRMDISDPEERQFTFTPLVIANPTFVVLWSYAASTANTHSAKIYVQRNQVVEAYNFETTMQNGIISSRTQQLDSFLVGPVTAKNSLTLDKNKFESETTHLYEIKGGELLLIHFSKERTGLTQYWLRDLQGLWEQKFMSGYKDPSNPLRTIDVLNNNAQIEMSFWGGDGVYVSALTNVRLPMKRLDKTDHAKLAIVLTTPQK